MTKTVKKRLQAVVALLVTLMIMIGIMPSDIFDGIFGVNVNADTTFTIYFDSGIQYGGSNNFNYNGNNVSYSSNWTVNSQFYLYYEGTDVTTSTATQTFKNSSNNDVTLVKMEKDTSVSTKGTNGGYVYKAVFNKKPSKIIFVAEDSNIWFRSGYNVANYSVDLTTHSDDGRVYHAKNGDDGTTARGHSSTNGVVAPGTADAGKRTVGTDYSISDYGGGGQQQTSSDKSILVGVKYYNYFYDEQIAYEMAGGTTDPTKITVVNGQAKNPYTLFNRAIMASDYGGNNTIGKHGSDGSGGNKTSYPVMYLGEFWVGGNAENGGSEAGSNYSSSPNVTVSNHVNNNGTTITNDKLTNFKWGANLASRGSGGAQMYYHMLAQGLVDETLSTDPTSPNYLVPTINGQRIPYFDEKFLYYANPNNSSEIWNADLADITSSKDVGHVYTSIFPFYRKNVKFTDTNAFTTSEWKDSWIAVNGENWGRSLTADNGTVATASEYYTFNSKTDTVSINTAGGASSDDGSGGSGWGTTYYDTPLSVAATTAPTNTVFTPEILARLKTEYSAANYTALGDNNRPVLDDTDKAQEAARAINTYKNGTMFTEDEIALMTIVGYFDTGDDGTGTGHVKDVDFQNGYFPFNTSSDGLSNLQYGFGTRLDIRFNINAGGLTTEGAPEIFRFTGDDDVWVFIDGQLVLDMGGGHKNGIGEINFENGKAAVLYAGSGSSESAWQTSTQGRGGSNGVKTTTPTILSSIKAEATNSATGISEDHTLTMFYMERGKLNSNMSVMFNFKAPDIINIDDPDKDFPPTPDKIPSPNPVTTSKLKIREISNFENVNPGLIGLTKKAAEDDVFKYTIKSNTIRQYPAMDYSWVFTPTYDTYTRNPGITGVTTTALSPTGRSSGTQKLVYLDVSNSTNTWKNAKYIGLWNETDNNSFHVGHEIAEDFYVFFIKDSDVGDLYRFYQTPSDSVVWTESTTKPSNVVDTMGQNSGLGHATGDSSRTLGDGRIYVMNSEGNWIQSNAALMSSQTYPTYMNDFAKTGSTPTMNDVANVNYIWKDAFATKTNNVGGDYVNTLNNTTTDSGTFNLLYGLSDDEHESSALFKNQFYDPVSAANSTPSYTSFNVSQSMVKRNNTENDVVNNWTLPTGGRVMGKYYSTRISTVKRQVKVNNVAQTLVENVSIANGEYDVARTATTMDNIAVNSPDMDIIISNYINVANVSVGKTVQYKTQGAIDESKTPEVYSDEYYFAVRITDVFGQVGNDVTDYRSVKYIKNNNTAEQFNMENVTVGTATLGKITIAAGEVATIIGIPEGTICDIVELHESKNFKSTAWASEYNVGVNGNSPTLTSTLYTGSDTNGTSLALSDTLTMNADGGNTTYTGLTNAWRITGAHDNPGYMRALLVFGNIAKDPPVNFSVKPIVLIVEKVWVTTETVTETSVKFEVKRQLVENGHSPSDDENEWTTFNIGTDGIVTLTSSDLVANSSPITWRKVLGDVADRSDSTHTYYYRIREWGKNDAVFVYKDGGFYSENFMAVYGDGTAESPVINLGSGDTAASESDNYRTVVKTTSGEAPNTTTTYTLTLQIKNEYRSTSIDPKPLPKTGAAGVRAIVTFGAFAITIAGVALLIYRKKLQTVNIYAVKGSEKKKE